MSYVRNAWYVASWSHELKPKAPLAITILGEPIVIWRTGDDSLHALEDRCAHRLAPLSLGRCENGQLRCMYHGLLYDPDGKVVEIPGQDVIPAQMRVRPYPVVEQDSWIWVWMGDSAPDADLIPRSIGLDDPDFVLGSGQLDYQAEARLISENLLDFSHIAYVHENSFGGGPAFAHTQARFTPIARGVRYERWIENWFGSASRRSEVPVDGYLGYDFVLPGILVMKTGNFPLGTATKSEFGAPDFADAVGGVTFTGQAVTPLTDQTARYFFSFGPHAAHGGEAQRDVLMDLTYRAFEEDRRIIEGQQKIINQTKVPATIPTAHDRGATMFNRMVERFARAEATT